MAHGRPGGCAHLPLVRDDGDEQATVGRVQGGHRRNDDHNGPPLAANGVLKQIAHRRVLSSEGNACTTQGGHTPGPGDQSLALPGSPRLTK
jgi:hypothetical protein